MMQQTESAEAEIKRRPVLIILVLSLSTLVAAVDTNIVNIGLPTISQAFHAEFSSVQWVMLSYMITVTAFIVGIGSIGDLFGKKWIFAAGLFLFTLASLLCGLSVSIYMLIAMRALQGLGGAILMALSFALVGDLIPNDKIIGSMAVLTVMLPIGFALGPTVGGILLSLGSWRGLFFFNVPLGLLALALALKFPNLPAAAQKARFDWLGMFLMSASLVSYVMGITRTENEGFSKGTILLFAGFIVGLTVFLFWERRAAVPLVDLTMFHSGTFSASLIVSVLVYTVITGHWLIVPFYLQQGKEYSTFICGLMMMVGPIGCAIFTPVSSWLANKFGSFLIMKLGVLIFAVGTFFMSTLNLNTTAFGFMATLFFFNGSLAFFQTPNNAEVIASARPEQRGVASGLLNLSRTVGQTTGTAIMGAIFYCYSGTKSLSQAQPANIVTGIRSAYFIAAFIAVAAFLVGLKWLIPAKTKDSAQKPND